MFAEAALNEIKERAVKPGRLHGLEQAVARFDKIFDRESSAANTIRTYDLGFRKRRRVARIFRWIVAARASHERPEHGAITQPLPKSRRARRKKSGRWCRAGGAGRSYKNTAMAVARDGSLDPGREPQGPQEEAGEGCPSSRRRRHRGGPGWRRARPEARPPVEGAARGVLALRAV